MSEPTSFSACVVTTTSFLTSLFLTSLSGCSHWSQQKSPLKAAGSKPACSKHSPAHPSHLTQGKRHRAHHGFTQGKRHRALHGFTQRRRHRIPPRLTPPSFVCSVLATLIPALPQTCKHTLLTLGILHLSPPSRTFLPHTVIWFTPSGHPDLCSRGSSSEKPFSITLC